MEGLTFSILVNFRIMSDHPSNHPDLSSHFHGLNMSAQPFVPSVHAPSFQPGGNYGPVYGSGQYMGGIEIIMFVV